MARSSSVPASEPWKREPPGPRNSSRGARIRGFVGSYRFRQLASSPGSSWNGSTVIGPRLVQAERLPARGVQVVDDRQQRLDDDLIAADARLQISRRGDAVAAEGVDRDQHEGRGGDDGGRQHAAARPMRGVAQAEARDRLPPGSADRAARRPPQQAGEQAERRPEQRRAGTEECAGPPSILPEDARGDQRHAGQRQGRGGPKIRASGPAAAALERVVERHLPSQQAALRDAAQTAQRPPDAERPPRRCRPPRRRPATTPRRAASATSSRPRPPTTCAAPS